MVFLEAVQSMGAEFEFKDGCDGDEFDCYFDACTTLVTAMLPKQVPKSISLELVKIEEAEFELALAQKTQVRYVVDKFAAFIAQLKASSR
jgi:hypothetical protein